MKNLLNLRPVISLFLLAMFVSQTSFVANTPSMSNTALNVFGGDGFEVYLNNKLVFQRFGKDMETIKNIVLDQTASNGQLSIRYFHCGEAGKNRVIGIKDESGKILVQWKFNDTKDAGTKLTCSVKEIMALPKLKAGQKVSLFYTSNELPEGRTLATITSSKGKVDA